MYFEAGGTVGKTNERELTNTFHLDNQNLGLE